MKFVLAYKSAALATHISAIRNKIIRSKRVNIPDPSHSSITPEQATLLRDRLGEAETVCGTAFSDSARRHNRFYRMKMARVDKNEKCFVHIGNGLYTPCPELTFMQMASELDFIELIRFGYDLCGSYAPGHGGRETLYELTPLTNAQKLIGFCEEQSGAYGASKALRAARHVVDCCASPAESNLSMMLCLPQRLGGYGIPKPVANLRYDKTRNIRVPDLYWKDFRLIVEYDSDEFHTDMTRDAIRRNQLQPSLRVLTVTHSIFSSLEKMDGLAEDFCKAAKLRRRVTCRGYTEKKSELHRVLNRPEWYKRLG